ncbi:MAG: glycosidase [Chitinivibrionales bacterium]|nr:glycosidase [Chitinivibrionales bacterium]
MNPSALMPSPLKRHTANPIITPQDMPFPCYTVMNAGAIMFEGKVLLLLRVETRERTSYFVKATSEDGVNFKINPVPINYPLNEYEKIFGAALRFDMRITEFDGCYYCCHAAWMPTWGCTLAMCKTTDFETFEPLQYMSPPANRNAVLFPEKINGLYCRLERPQGGRISMWVSYSPDLEFWGRHMPVHDLPRFAWGNNKNGAGCVPIKSDRGWLEIYHSTSKTCSSENYYLGAVLLDLENPAKVIAAPPAFILAAEAEYEVAGQTPNVVFTGGAVQMPDGTLNVYYAGADTRMCLAQTTIEDLVEYCLAGA